MYGEPFSHVPKELLQLKAAQRICLGYVKGSKVWENALEDDGEARLTPLAVRLQLVVDNMSSD